VVASGSSPAHGEVPRRAGGRDATRCQSPRQRSSLRKVEETDLPQALQFENYGQGRIFYRSFSRIHADKTTILPNL